VRGTKNPSNGFRNLEASKKSGGEPCRELSIWGEGPPGGTLIGGDENSFHATDLVEKGGKEASVRELERKKKAGQNS